MLMDCLVNVDFIEPQDPILAIVYDWYLEIVDLVVSEAFCDFAG
jgi:hypothetical protein